MYERIFLLTKEILAAAESNEWEEALRLQHELDVSFDPEASINWLALNKAERELLASTLEGCKTNISKIETLFNLRQKYLAAELQQFNKTNKINKAYSSRNI